MNALSKARGMLPVFPSISEDDVLSDAIACAVCKALPKTSAGRSGDEETSLLPRRRKTTAN
jgi:hypothetical protein